MAIICFEKIIDELSVLESLIVTTKDSCTHKDLNNKNYQRKDLSYERNNYINNLNLALSIIYKIKNILE